MAKPANTLLTTPEQHGNELSFPIPVEDFAFSLHTLGAEPQTLAQSSAAIIFCVEGQTVLNKGEQQVVLHPGESCYIPALDSPVIASGNGRIARVFNQLG